MISLLITFLVLVIVLAIFYAIIRAFNPPAPIMNVVNIVMMAIVALWLIFYVLLPLAGHSYLR